MSTSSSMTIRTIRRGSTALGGGLLALALALTAPAAGASAPSRTAHAAAVSTAAAATPNGAEVVATDGPDYFTAPRTDPLDTYSAAGVWPSAFPTLITNGRRDESGIPGGQYWTSTFYTVRVTGVLELTSVLRDSTGTSSTHTAVGRGWGSVTDLVWADQPSTGTPGTLLFAKGDAGLYRYTVDASGRPRSAGFVHGFDSVRGLTLLRATDTETVLLANLSGGSLYTITVPAGGTFRTTVARVRASTWGALDVLVSSSTGAGRPVLLTGVDRDTQKAYSYTVGAPRGSATRITGLGQRAGTYPVNLRYGALSWDFSDFTPR